MESNTHSIQLGLLSQSEIQEISSLSSICECYFTNINQSFASGAASQKILLDLRGDYVIQLDPTTKNIICGFQCDYSINFEIVRSPPQAPFTLGFAQGIDFIFKVESDRKVSLVAEEAAKLQIFAKKLEKKYIVQLGFRDGFKAVKILGKGVTATVYKATRYRDQNDVAIKSFKRSVYFATENGKLSFQKQFKILTMIHHRHICGVESVYETQNSTYIVMQNLALSLFGWIQKYGFPSFQTARLMILQLLKGIQHLHSKGIMHRDLKLENIMVRKDSKENPEIVIVDLGLAQFVNNQKFLYTRCGTPGYVAPQILRAKTGQTDRYNESCDIFSIGVIFHILFFHKSLFDGKQYKQVIKKNTECEINFDDEIYTRLCSEGMDLLKRMLQKDPAKRITATDALNHQFIQPINIENSGFKDGCTLLSLNNIA